MFTITSYQEALESVTKICKEKDYVFLGFCEKDGKDILQDGWHGVRNVYLKLHCNKCGKTWSHTSYKRFISGNGCKYCALLRLAETKRLKNEQVLTKISDICKVKNIVFHGFVNDIYTTSTKTFLKLSCTKCGYYWESTCYHNFECGGNCPNCNTSNLEMTIYNLLKSKKIIFEHNKRYKILDSLQLDFLCVKTNIAIECQGAQHFISNKYYGGDEGLIQQKERDKRKKMLCENNNIKLYYVVDSLDKVDWSNSIYTKDNTFDIKTFIQQFDLL